MNNKLTSLFLVTLFITSAMIAVPSAAAHFTLGANGPAGSETPRGGLPWLAAPNMAGTYSNPDNHVASHLAYVSPGVLYTPPNAQANYYSPNGSVLVDTTGDLKFYINISATDTGARPGTSQPGINISACCPNYLYIAIPPEFTPSTDWEESGATDAETINRGRGDSSSVSTTITNDHRFIQVGKFQGSHKVAPGWWFVRISAPNVTYPAPYPEPWLGTEVLSKDCTR